MERHRIISYIAILQMITAIGLIAFWIAFFGCDMTPNHPPPCYFAYEHAFPIPDIILSIFMMIASICLINKKPSGIPLSIATAGALFFLGILDTCFNYQNGIYASSFVDMIGNGFINVWCIFFGTLVIKTLS